MKNKKLAGFTLVECIVAIAVLSIGTLVMASIYGCISQINEKTNRVNESLGETIQRVEMKSDKGPIPATPSGDYTVFHGPTNTQITYTKVVASGTAPTYTMETNVYVIYSKDTATHGNTKYSNPNADPIELRYKYFAKSE